MFPGNTWQHDVLAPGGSAHGPEQHHQQKQLQLQHDNGEGLAAQLVQLRPALFECAAHVAAPGRFDAAAADRCFDRVLGLAALGDGPLQRLARILVDCLARRRVDRAIGRALIDPSAYLDRRTLRAARSGFVRLLPFLEVAYIAINRVILDAMENEKFVHIIDLSGPAAHSWQWIKLMHAFRARPEGTPDLRITVVHDDEVFLDRMAALLRKEAESLDMAFSFHGVVGRLETLDFGDLHAALGMKSGYARAFSCALQMHRLLAVDGTTTGAAPLLQHQQQAAAAFPLRASSISIAQYVHEMMKANLDDRSPTTPLSPFAPTPTPSPQCLLVTPPLLARFLLAVRAASPKVVAVVEQEASHNAPDFAVRFQEALHYYAALFDALHDAAGGAGAECEVRALVEQFLLGEQLKDILVREGTERRERHEPLHQWAARMAIAGFGGVPLSYVAKMEADEVLRKLMLRGYENRGHENCLLLCRSGRPLYAVSAWRPWSPEASASVRSRQQQHTVVVPEQMTSSTWTWPQQQVASVHNFTG